MRVESVSFGQFALLLVDHGLQRVDVPHELRFQFRHLLIPRLNVCVCVETCACASFPLCSFSTVLRRSMRKTASDLKHKNFYSRRRQNASTHVPTAEENCSPSFAHSVCLLVRVHDDLCSRLSLLNTRLFDVQQHHLLVLIFSCLPVHQVFQVRQTQTSHPLFLHKKGSKNT